MRVQVFKSDWVDMKRSVVQKIARCEANNLCWACEQPFVEGEKVIRHNHMRCAKATYRAIESGKTTDAERVEQGKWSSPASGRKPTNPVTMEVSGVN